MFLNATANTTGINSNDLTRLNSLFNDLMGVVGTVQKVFYSDGKTFPTADQQLNFQQRASRIQLLRSGRLARVAAAHLEPGRAL